MPQILDAFVCFASLMQRYEFFMNRASFLPIIFQKKTGVVSHFSTFSLLTLAFSKSVKRKSFIYIIIYNNINE